MAGPNVSSVERTAAYLLTFKGWRGKCARLAELSDLLDNGCVDRRGGISTHATEPGDPTMAMAMASLSRRDGIAKARDEIEAELSRVGFALTRVAHGTLLDDYYLTADDVSWQQVCDWYNAEHGSSVSLRTIYRWRDAALEELAHEL